MVTIFTFWIKGSCCNNRIGCVEYSRLWYRLATSLDAILSFWQSGSFLDNVKKIRHKNNHDSQQWQTFLIFYLFILNFSPW